MGNEVVVAGAGRTAVIPDDAGRPPTSTGLVDEVIGALLRGSRIDSADLTALYLTESAPRRRGAAASDAPFGLPTISSGDSTSSIVRALDAVREDPRVVAVVAAADLGPAPASSPERPGGWAEAERAVAARWRVSIDEAARWAGWSYRRAATCAAAGDFADEIVTTVREWGADRFRDPAAGERPDAGTGRGMSAMILTSSERAGELGLRPRAVLHARHLPDTDTAGGIAPLDACLVDDLLARYGLGIGSLDQLEVPEHSAVTPVAWGRETGISKYLINPRGGDLAFGRLPRSGRLRSLVSMLHSLEATGGRAGACFAGAGRGSAALVLARSA